MSNTDLVLTTNDAQLATMSDSQRAVLTQRTPSAVVKQRRGPGGLKFSYVEHSWVTRTLNEAFAWNWSWEILEWRLIPQDEPNEVFVLGKLTVNTPTGTITKQQFGSASVKRSKSSKKPLSVGDDLKAASSDALKKCASLLGLALDLYSKDAPAGQAPRRAAPPQRRKQTRKPAPAAKPATETAKPSTPTNGAQRHNGGNGPRSWKAVHVQALLQEDLAQAPKHAVAMLNLSNLDPDAANRLDAVAWARQYRQARESGLGNEAAAARVNGTEGV